MRTSHWEPVMLQSPYVRSSEFTPQKKPSFSEKTGFWVAESSKNS